MEKENTIKDPKQLGNFLEWERRRESRGNDEKKNDEFQIQEGGEPQTKNKRATLKHYFLGKQKTEMTNPSPLKMFFVPKKGIIFWVVTKNFETLATKKQWVK